MVSLMLLAAIVAATAFGVLLAYAMCRSVFAVMGGRRPRLARAGVVEQQLS